MRSASGGARGGGVGFSGVTSTPALPGPDEILEADHRVSTGVATYKEDPWVDTIMSVPMPTCCSYQFFLPKVEERV
jgi:hypothetical protein